MLGTIHNPYNISGRRVAPEDVRESYQTLVGNPVYALSREVAKYPTSRLPATITKSGESLNAPPRQLPTSLVGVKAPQRSSSSHALIETDRVGERLGEPDVYRDDPYKDWTYGVQYYKVYEGGNPKTEIPFVLYPQSHRAEVWAQNDVTFPEVNREDTQDITDLEMSYSCKQCSMPSASLGAPVMYEPRNPTAPLPVQWPGETSINGGYTARELGANTRDFPQPVNPIVESQKRALGLPATYITPNYDNKLLKDLRMGFEYY